LVDDVLNDNGAPKATRHQALQLALVFVCGVNQLSPGAYFLRRDLFPGMVSVSVLFLFGVLTLYVQ